MKNPRILFIAPNSYPPINAEANVNSKVIKLLTDAGCVIDVICREVKGVHTNYQSTEAENLFYNNVESINIIEDIKKYDFNTIIRHIKTFVKIGYVYKGSDWAYKAAKKCDELIAKNSYDFIYTYDYPSELVGLYVAKRYSIKWLATWNDPYIWHKYPAPYGQGANFKEGSLRRRVIKGIGKYTTYNAFPSQRLRDYMLGYMYGMKRENTVILHHLVEDSMSSKNSKQPKNSTLTLKFLHSGALGKERDPKTLLEGIALFLQKVPQAKVEFTFMGVVERSGEGYVSNMIKNLGLEDYVRLIPPVSYVQSLNVSKGYDVYLVVEADLENGIFLPSKIADYLQNNKPIFTISPTVGTLNDEYKAGVIDYFADVKSPQAIASEIELIYTNHINDKLICDNKDFSKYQNREITNIHKQILGC